jgi:hypothetical protein
MSFQTVHNGEDEDDRDGGPSLSGFLMFTGIVVVVGAAVFYLGPRFAEGAARGARGGL